MRAFTFSELWGPFACEQRGCKQNAFTIILTDAENASLPEESGPRAARLILENKLGKAACDECLKSNTY